MRVIFETFNAYTGEKKQFPVILICKRAWRNTYLVDVYNPANKGTTPMSVDDVERFAGRKLNFRKVRTY